MAVRVAFAGTNWWAAQVLERLAGTAELEIARVISQPDRPAGRGRKPAPPAVAVTARALGLALAQPERPAEALPLLERDEAQAVAVVAYGELVPRSLLDAAAVRQPASLRAAPLARRRPGRARADGGRARLRRRGHAARRGAGRGPGGRARAFRGRPGRGCRDGLRACARAGARSVHARAARRRARTAGDRAADRRRDLRRQDHGG